MLETRKLVSESRRLAPLAIVAVLLLALAALASGCGGSGGEVSGPHEAESQSEEAKLSPAEVPEVTLALVGKEVSLNLGAAPTVPTISLMANVARGLVAYGVDGSLHNELAESVKQVSPTEYLYTLKPGLRFSTGKPVTTDDVVYSLEYSRNPKTGAATSSFYITVKSIEKVGSNQIKVTLTEPDPTWRYLAGYYGAWIYEKQSLVDAGENLGGPQGIPVGTGPYAISEFTNDHITFVRNKYYSGPKPPVEKFIVKVLADPGTSLAAMQSGDIDGSIYVPLQSANQWEGIQGVQLFSALSPNSDTLWFNTTKGPFADPHVRRAFYYAFDREAVANSVLHGYAKVFPNTNAPPLMWTNQMSAAEAEERTPEMGREFTYDMEEAKAELAKTKYGNGFSATAIYPSSAPELGLALQVLSQSLKELGINLKVEELGDTTFYSKQFEGEYEMSTTTGSFDYPDPLDWRSALCSCAIPPNGFNASRFDSPKMDRLFDEAYADTNAASRADKTVEAVAFMTEEAPSPLLWFRSVITALGSGLALTDLGPWQAFVTPWMTDIGEPASE